jgi:cytoskeletal protein RodZ
MARGSFGERLKRERELREVSLNEVTVATRISTRFLQALENEDWNKLPGGVFNRGFVRSVARYLGLDEENLLAEYDMARGLQAPEASAISEPRAPSPPDRIAPAAVLAALLVLGALVAAAIYLWHRYAAHRGARPASAVFASTTPCASALLLQLNGPANLLIGPRRASGTMVLSAISLRQPHGRNSQS